MHTQTFTPRSLSPLLSLSIPLPPLCCHGNRSRAVSCGSFQVKHTSRHKHTHTQNTQIYPFWYYFDEGLAAVKFIKDVFNLYWVGNTQPKSLCYLHIFLSTFQGPLSPLTRYKLFYCTGCHFINRLLCIRQNNIKSICKLICHFSS